MRRPRMSTGAWIFSGLICAAVIAPASVYAAAITKTALVGPDGSHTSRITEQHQLLTTEMSPNQIIRGYATTPTDISCKTVYTPPANKAIVVTSVVYAFGSESQGIESYGGLYNLGCTKIYDQYDGVEFYQTMQHTFPTGVPMNGVAVNAHHGAVAVFVYGYLIDAASLPASAR